MPYKFFFVPLIIIIISQMLKLVTSAIRGNVNFKNALDSYGGMPSSHAAIVSSISTIVAIEQGLSSIPFAITLIFHLLLYVMRLDYE